MSAKNRRASEIREGGPRAEEEALKAASRMGAWVMALEAEEAGAEALARIGPESERELNEMFFQAARERSAEGMGACQEEAKRRGWGLKRRDYQGRAVWDLALRGAAEHYGSDAELTEAANWLLERGGAMDFAENKKERVLPLHRAVEAGNLELARQALRMGSEASGADEDGEAPAWLPLERACAAGREDLARLLLEAGANPMEFLSRKGRDGKEIGRGATATEAAAREGEWECVRLCLERGGSLAVAQGEWASPEAPRPSPAESPERGKIWIAAMAGRAGGFGQGLAAAKEQGAARGWRGLLERALRRAKEQDPAAAAREKAWAALGNSDPAGLGEALGELGRLGSGMGKIRGKPALFWALARELAAPRPGLEASEEIGTLRPLGSGGAGRGEAGCLALLLALSGEEGRLGEEAREALRGSDAAGGGFGLAHWATLFGRADLVGALAAAGARMKEGSLFGEIRPGALAARLGERDCLLALREAGALDDLGEDSDWAENPMAEAVAAGSEELARLCLEAAPEGLRGIWARRGLEAIGRGEGAWGGEERSAARALLEEAVLEEGSAPGSGRMRRSGL